jgi:hypothetical protein
MSRRLSRELPEVSCRSRSINLETHTPVCTSCHQFADEQILSGAKGFEQCAYFVRWVGFVERQDCELW